MIASIRHYLYAAVMAVLAFFGLYLYREGRKDERDKLSRDNLDAMREAKEIRHEVESDPYFVDRAHKWVRNDDK